MLGGVQNSEHPKSYYVYYNASRLITSGGGGGGGGFGRPRPASILANDIQPTIGAPLCILIGRGVAIDEQTNKHSVAYSQGEVVEAHRPQGEGPRQEAHVREQNPDGVLEGGQFLEDRRRLDQLPVRLRLLDLDKKKKRVWDCSWVQNGSKFQSNLSKAAITGHIM